MLLITMGRASGVLTAIKTVREAKESTVTPTDKLNLISHVKL